MKDEGKHGATPFLGELLLRRGLVTEAQVQRALRLQVGGNRRLGHLLIKMGFISDDDLLQALSDQLKLPIVDIARSFDRSASRVLPRYLCRKYSILPLGLEEDRMLRLAMVDPLDAGALKDVENFTGLVVDPVLARQREIDRSIGRLIPWSWRDVLNPQVYGGAARGLTVLVLALILLAGFLLWREVRRERFGTVVERDGATSYRNLDLVIEKRRDGSIGFMGRGAFASGYYGVSFPDAGRFAAFIAAQERQLSERQREWVRWIVEERLGGGEEGAPRRAPPHRNRPD